MVRGMTWGNVQNNADAAVLSDSMRVNKTTELVGGIVGRLTLADTLRVAGRLDMNNSVILRQGVDIASAATITIGNSNFYAVTGNTTSTDIAGPAMPAGKHQIVTLYVTTGWHITAGNHWKINGNFDGNATGNKDSITFEWDGTDATECCSGRVIQ